MIMKCNKQQGDEGQRDKGRRQLTFLSRKDIRSDRNTILGVSQTGLRSRYAWKGMLRAR